MTLKQLQKRIDVLLGQMHPLGLGHWTINLSIVDEVASDYALGAHASCTCSTHYDVMWLEFSAEFIEEGTYEEIDRVIIHELVHATMRDLDHQIDEVSEYLGEPHKSVWQSNILHAREGLVEKLAQTLNHALRSNVVR